MEINFHINYENTPFIRTSETGAYTNRLNWRCEILLARNQEAIKGKRVLDLASHDGRFSYPCLKLGASHVTGVEGRHHLVEFSRESMAGLGYTAEHFDFIVDDIFNYMPEVIPKQFDTILCFGFFYHTLRQIELLAEIKRIRPTYFILDTCVERGTLINPFPLLNLRPKLRHLLRVHSILNRPREVASRLSVNKKACLVFRPESHLIEGATTDAIDLIAWPTKNLIELLLKYHGFNIKQLDWSKKDIKDWTALADYKAGHRISYIAQSLE